MQPEKRWHLLLSVILLLVTSGRSSDSRGGANKDKRNLLDLLVRAVEERERINSQERSIHLARLDHSRPVEIVVRNVSIKDKFIKHFTGPVKFSSECRTHFHRIYHNTKDCTRPAYYKRCARLLMRLAMSPLCAQP